jgi:hypothetical protein
VHHWPRIFVLMSCIVLSACSTMIKSEVTSFHEWPQDLQDKSYAFVQTREQANNLEYRNYQNLVRAELRRLGFVENMSAPPAKLSISMEYQMDGGRDVRDVYPVTVDPYPWYGPGFYGPYWPYYGYSPWAYPYWYGPPVVEYRESRYRLFTRQLKIGIMRVSDGKKMYEVTVHSEGTNGSLAAVMPYMIRSAFTDFPGPSGVPRTIKLEMQNEPAESETKPADSEIYS